MSTQIRGTSWSVKVTPTISSSPAYSSGDQIGGIQTLTGAMINGGTGTLMSVVVLDKAAQKSALNIWFFKNQPTMASTDNAAFDITDANLVLAEPLGFVSIAAADYVDSSSNAVGQASLADAIMVQSAASDGTIYAVVESAGTPTYGSTSDLVFTYFFAQD